MIATLVITAFFGFLYVCAAIMDARNLARRPMKVPEWRPSIPMYFVKDEFGVTHWLGLDLELAKLYLEPGWKLGEGHPNIKVDWTWMTYDQVFPKPTTGPIETVGPVGRNLYPHSRSHSKLARLAAEYDSMPRSEHRHEPSKR